MALLGPPEMSELSSQSGPKRTFRVGRSRPAEFFARRSARQCQHFFQPLTPPTALGLLTASSRAEIPPVGQGAARSLPERWPAVSLVGKALQHCRLKAIESR